MILYGTEIILLGSCIGACVLKLHLLNNHIDFYFFPFSFIFLSFFLFYLGLLSLREKNWQKFGNFQSSKSSRKPLLSVVYPDLFIKLIHLTTFASISDKVHLSAGESWLQYLLSEALRLLIAPSVSLHGIKILKHFRQ